MRWRVKEQTNSLITFNSSNNKNSTILHIQSVCIWKIFLLRITFHGMIVATKTDGVYSAETISTAVFVSSADTRYQSNLRMFFNLWIRSGFLSSSDPSSLPPESKIEFVDCEVPQEYICTCLDLFSTIYV